MPNYFASSPYPHEVAWPKTAYHAEKDSKIVNSQAELDALGAEWSTNYADKKREFPKMLYKAKKAEDIKEGGDWYDTLVVDNPEAQGKAGAGWADKAPPKPEHHAKADAEGNHEPVKKGR